MSSIREAMRQLNQTGWMHNRLRMVTATFLTKDLLVDWRWGERYFARHLIDYDLASNNGGWQWSASTGCDAQPYFRVFNPESQAKKFDRDGKFVRRFVPELGTDAYPTPIVDHGVQRLRAIRLFREHRLSPRIVGGLLDGLAFRAEAEAQMGVGGKPRVRITAEDHSVSLVIKRPGLVSVTIICAVI
jgi:hypothetical protein